MVQRLVEAAGIKLKRVGKDLAGRCPLYKDSEPRLFVRSAKNLWCWVNRGWNPILFI